MAVALLFSVILPQPSFLRAADLVRFPEGPAAWTVEVSRLDDSESGADGPGATKPAPDDGTAERPRLTLKHIEVTQDGTQRRQIEVYEDGKNRETWTIVGVKQVLAEDPNGTVFFTTEPVPFDQSAFDWITSATLQSTAPEVCRGKSCLHYRGERTVILNGSYMGTLVFKAWIDTETLLPVMLISGADMGIYHFSPTPPAGPLTVTERFRRPLETKRRILKKQ